MTMMTDIRHWLLALTAMWLCQLAMHAQTADTTALRPILSMMTADVGYASVHDDYLTPITYSGVDVAIGYEAMRAAWFDPEQWVWQLLTDIDYNHIKNPAGNRTMHRLMADLAVGMMHRWRGVTIRHFDLAVGPMLQVSGGAIYNAANSNNVVSAKCYINMGATAMAAYHTKLWRLPISLRYATQLPMVGVFFAPQYDESYYEIYLGNHRELAHVGWWGNRLDVTHQLTADLRLSNIVLRIGYRARYERSSVSHLVTHNVTHSVVLGIGGEWLAVGRKHHSNPRRIISSLY